MSRSFGVIGIDKLSHSIFHSQTPISAAAKAFNSSCGNRRKCSKVMCVIDNETHKQYKYKVTRRRSDKNVVLDGKTVNFKFEVGVKSLNSGGGGGVKTSTRFPSKAKSSTKEPTKTTSKKSSAKKQLMCIQKCLEE